MEIYKYDREYNNFDLIEDKEEYDHVNVIFKERLKEQKLETAKYNHFKNETLIKWENIEFTESTVTMLFLVAGIAIAIIIGTSVFCIKNSFYFITTFNNIKHVTINYGFI